MLKAIGGCAGTQHGVVLTEISGRAVAIFFGSTARFVLDLFGNPKTGSLITGLIS